MKFAVPADRFAFGWQAVWPAVATDAAVMPFFRSVIVERYETPDVLHLWTTDGALMLRSIVPAEGTVFTVEMWDEIREADPVSQVIAHDAFAHGKVLAKTAAALSKDDEDVDVVLTIGRRSHERSTPALAEELEPLQAVLATEGLSVDLVALEMTPPDWRKLEPSIDLGARVKRIGFRVPRLKRLASVPGVHDLHFQFRTSTGAAVVEFTTPSGLSAPVRGYLMPVRDDDAEGVMPSGDVLAAEFQEYLSEQGRSLDTETGEVADDDGGDR